MPGVSYTLQNVRLGGPGVFRTQVVDVCAAAGRGWEGVSPGLWLEVREGEAVCTPARRGEPGAGRKEGRRDHHTLTPEWKPGLLELRSCVGLTVGDAGAGLQGNLRLMLTAGVRRQEPEPRSCPAPLPPLRLLK